MSSDWLRIYDVTEIHVGTAHKHSDQWMEQIIIFKKADGSQFQLTAYSPRQQTIETKIDQGR